MKLAILDYGVGNIGSLVSAIKRLGISDNDFAVLSQAEELKHFNKFILPGVGSFDYCMDALRKCELQDALNEEILQHKKHILGICAGAQIMGISSEEGCQSGLGWLNMQVKKFPGHRSCRLPHIGWNDVSATWEHDIFSGVDLAKKFYFSHSYYFSPSQDTDVLAMTQYEMNFASVVSWKNIYAIQFHPEKSHLQGLQIIKNFVNLK